jgi:hypothetical protein
MSVLVHVARSGVFGFEPVVARRIDRGPVIHTEPNADPIGVGADLDHDGRRRRLVLARTDPRVDPRRVLSGVAYRQRGPREG